MTVIQIASGLFREPDASKLINCWLETQASPAERAACIRFLSLLGSAQRAPSARKTSYPGTLAPKPRADSNDAGAASGGALQIAAVGQAKDLRARPASCAGRQAAALPLVPPRPASAVQTRPCHSTHLQAQGETGWITSNDVAFGFRVLYPELYNAAASATKAVPAPNLTFKSEYSDSLKKGAGEYWKRFLVTTSESTNQSVHKPQLDQQARKDKGFYDWMKNQQLYYGSLLTSAAASALDKLLEHADAQTKTDILFGSRCFFAVLRPDRNKSVSHLHHKDLKSLSDPFFEALGKEVTKIKTMGHPGEVKQRKLPPAQRAPVAPSISDANGKVNSAGCVTMDVNTYSSKVPMKWAVGGGPNTTTYMATIGSAGVQAAAACKQKRDTCYKPIVITCPIGSVDPVTDISRFSHIPVPECYLAKPINPFQEASRNPPDTTNRLTYQKRASEDIAKTMASAARQVAESKKAKNISTIPLGKGGYNIPHDGLTEKSRSFHPWPIDIAENNAASMRAKLRVNGPTSSVGVTLGGRLL